MAATSAPRLVLFPCISLVFLLLRTAPVVEGTNLEIRLPMVKEGPADSLFGFSLAEHRTTTRLASPSNGYEGSLVVVGAPKYNDPVAAVPFTGAVFKCPLSTFVDDCEDLQLDVEEEFDPVWNRTDQWLGVTVRSQGPGGKVAACAHRYKKIYTDEIGPLGKCFLRSSDLSEYDNQVGAWRPCDSWQTGKKYYTHCQSGSGFYMTKESDGDFGGVFVAGAPGAGNWRGGVFVTNIIGETHSFIDGAETLLNDESTGVSLNSYLGFSVTSGKFGPDLVIASGAPRYNAIGAVVIMGKHLTDNGMILRQMEVLHGEQLSESFGYEVCSADLDGDGYDDLLVGAPIYYDRNTAAGGRVYIYLNKNQNGDFAGIEPIRLTGPLDSMFGIAITNLGDLNLDGYEDVAIGAPYENTEGAVYIYMGGPKGIVQPESQKIMPSDLPSDLPTTRNITTGFGYSLSGGIDLDGNQYPDLSIGSFEANSVVTLRARPIVNVTAELIFDNKELDANTTNFVYNGKRTFSFNVTARMKYACNAEDFDSRVEVVYSIEAEEERRLMSMTSRIIFPKTNSYAIRDRTMTLRPQSQENFKYTPKFLAILRPGFTDIFRAIPFKLIFKLKELDVKTPAPGDDLPDMNELPILNTLYDPSYQSELDFRKECAQDDGKCITDLDLMASLKLNGTPPVLRVGQENDLYVDVVLKNLDEPAYDAKLTITFPEILGFSKIEDDASQTIRHNCNLRKDNNTVIECTLGNPYPELGVERFTIKFDATEVPSDASNFTIRMTATSTNEDSRPENNHVDLFAEVESLTDIQVLCALNAPQLTFGGDVRGESTMNFTDEIGDEVIHTWTVLNDGPGIIPESVLTVSFPYEVANGKWLLYMTHAPEVTNGEGYCEIDPMYVNELNIKERPQEPGYDEAATVYPTVGGVAAPSEAPSPSAAPAQGGRKRREADKEPVARPQERTQSQQVAKGQNITLDCFNGRARCFDFKCYIGRLDDKENAEVTVRSRLWNSTLMEDYLNAKIIRVVSSGNVEIMNAPFLSQNNLFNDELNVTLNVVSGVALLPPPEPLAWWIILLAVLGGLLILIILILILWKCGFFERKSMAYKYATVTQKTPGGNAATEKTGYIDEKYFT